MEQTTYAARWIFPVESAPLPGGAITIVGDRIAAVEPHGTRSPDVDLGNVAILPGFVNAHTHLDLTGARVCRPPASNVAASPDFTQWLRHVIAFRRTRSPEHVQADIATGLAECLRFGTTMLGDISAGQASWELVGQSPCRARVFYEMIGLSEERAQQSWRGVQDWCMKHASMARCFTGLSPHAPYSVRRSLYQMVGAGTLPNATHLAETQAELELLRFRSGPFVDFLKELNVWDPSGLVDDPLDVMKMLPRGVFVHCNYLDPTAPFTPTQTVVVCPRTHAAFGHPRHPFPEMLERGVRVALGTDSLASNPDLDILEEARFLRRHYPEVDPAEVLRMLTVNGAEALGFGGVTGSLAPGKSADLVVVPLADVQPGPFRGSARQDPHDLVLDSIVPVANVMACGEWIIDPFPGFC
jgi:cytosine/adenosine deaminase-related metal-dependent hydrolase